MSSAKRTKLVIRKTSPVTKVAIVIAAILSVVAIVALYGSITGLRNQYDKMRDNAMALESGNATLKENIADLGSVESALRIAMEELGMTFPDSVIFAPKE
jgi:cell division protein FtsB